MNQAYPIGTPGQKWGDTEKAAWLARQSIKRSYQQEVVAKIQSLKTETAVEVEQYGALPFDVDKYPLLVVKTTNFSSDKTTVLITGGVHGYETSGVQGAIRFIATAAERYSEHFNIIVAPCISPWGYETINRWNPKAVDPNRSFSADGQSEEATALMQYINGLNLDISGHIDLHETTDTDNSEFRPALAARDNSSHDNWNIPDGFYLVGDTENPVPDFQKAMIEAVEKVTHIAPPDENGAIIGEKLAQHGVINYPCTALSLCAGFTNAKYKTTTEVYPDSPSADDENCIIAQVAAITSGLDYILANR
ncbi:MAG: hypothetical protein ACI8WB_004295 [Phenylobacterium sp.]|jgi:hypothetical protein